MAHAASPKKAPLIKVIVLGDAGYANPSQFVYKTLFKLDPTLNVTSSSNFYLVADHILFSSGSELVKHRFFNGTSPGAHIV
jgi:hypothetical protein